MFRTGNKPDILPISTLPLKGCHSFQYLPEGGEKQEIVVNTFRMFGPGSYPRVCRQAGGI